MNIRLWNTLGRALQPFEPLQAGRVSMYCCGPTVYDYAHIGNLRTYVFEDLLRRLFEYVGYRVDHVMNITDVGHLTDDGDEGEDKMLVGARERKMSVWEIARFFENAFFADTRALSIIPPTVSCRATEHIDDMIALIRQLEERGLTYQSGGNVYYSIDAFPRYGEMALLDRQDLKAGARISVDAEKRNPHDFVLWFTKGKFEHQTMQWDSPWGRGYPGWHVECSAMSMKYLGDRFDIHCGGVDHISVHHTNEIAQSDGATGHETVRYWLHGEFLIMDAGRMGKSEGNALTLATVREHGFDPLDYRYYLLGAHYRTQLRFSWKALEAARSARLGLVDRLRELVNQAGGAALAQLALPDRAGDPATLSDAGLQARSSIQAALAEDLNVPKALGMVRAATREEAMPPVDRLALAFELDAVFGLGLQEAATVTDELDPELQQMIREREAARRERDFSHADALRDKLQQCGVAVEDTPSGTVWRRV